MIKVKSKMSLQLFICVYIYKATLVYIIYNNITYWNLGFIYFEYIYMKKIYEVYNENICLILTKKMLQYVLESIDNISYMFMI